MEDMNITEAVNNTMEVPATGAETVDTKGNIIATVVGVGGVIALWEGAKWLGKKVVNGVKTIFKKDKAENAECGTTEAEEEVEND